MKRHHIQRLCELSKVSNGERRTPISGAVRVEVLKKTRGTCHVCGGRAGKSWQADHVVPHRLGGTSDVSNLLPICPACNVLKRSHEPGVLRLILQLGMCARSEIRKDTPLGRGLLDAVMGRNRSNRQRRVFTQ